METLETVTAARPRTLAGVVAKMHAALAEKDGDEDPPRTLAERWMREAVADLLRLSGLETGYGEPV